MKSRRTTLALHNELKLLLVDLESVSSPEAAAWKGRLDAALVQPLLSDPTRKLIEEARAWIERTISDETRHEQRAAVLRALAGIGYEVRDGMATAWVEQGRIILRKPNESAYGIELSASVQGSAVQTRVVALSDSPRDPQRDLEVEESWCGEFARARGFLNEAGFNASLVHWHPAGSVPLKTVVTQSSHQNDLRILKSHKAPRNNPEK